MSLRIRRGTNAQRASITFDLGEIAYTTDTKKLYIGDGTTVGGKHVLATSAGNGFTFNESTQQIEFSLDNLDLDNLNLSTTGVPEGTRLYFTDERAQDAVAAALVAGNPFNTGVTFTYDDANNRITAVSTGAGNSGIASVSADTTPSLGGSLSLNGFNISGSGTISATSLSSTTLTVTNLGGSLNASSYNITGIGSLGATTLTATNLGGNLSAASYNITNIGSLGATTLTATNLGGNLSANTYNITNIGNLGATTLTATNLGGSLNANNYSITGVNSLGATSISTPTISGGNTGINLTTDGTTPLTILGVGALSQFSGQVYFNINAAKGTIAAPTTTAAGDVLGGIAIQGYNGTDYKSAGQIVARWDAGAVLSDSFPKSTLAFAAYGGGNNFSSLRIATFNNQGVFNAPIFKATNYATESYPADPEKGWIIFDSTTNKFMGHNGTAWVEFTGP